VGRVVGTRARPLLHAVPFPPPNDVVQAQDLGLQALHLPLEEVDLLLRGSGRAKRLVAPCNARAVRPCAVLPAAPQLRTALMASSAAPRRRSSSTAAFCACISRALVSMKWSCGLVGETRGGVGCPH
jgi:hypothetical protein